MSHTTSRIKMNSIYRFSPILRTPLFSPISAGFRRLSSGLMSHTTSRIKMNSIYRFSPILRTPLISPISAGLRRFSAATSGGDNDWNDAWETAWLPSDKPTTRDPWETPTTPSLPADVDAETRAFVEEMNENWDQRRRNNRAQQPQMLSQTQVEEQLSEKNKSEGKGLLYGVESMKKDYRVKKQRIHASLWVKEIEKQQEAKLMGDDADGEQDDIQRLLDSCSEIFDSPNANLDSSKIPSSSELKNKPDGWETTAKTQDGSVWEMSQREEDVLLQEFERRIAFCKFQIASFIKQHIFSRRRPIDGWKYMIEEIGPNARKGKGSVLRLPSLADEATQPFREERTPIASNSGYIKGR